MDRGRSRLRRASKCRSAGAALAASALVVATSMGCSKDDEPPPAAPVTDDAGDPDGASSVPDATAVRIIGPTVECAIGSAIEEEPNDTPATANAFTELSYCGVLATPTDVDYFTFDTPAGTKLAVFQGIIDGKVDFELMQNGATFGPADTDRFGSGKVLVKAFTKAGKPASYRIRVQFDPT